MLHSLKPIYIFQNINTSTFDYLLYVYFQEWYYEYLKCITLRYDLKRKIIKGDYLSSHIQEDMDLDSEDEFEDSHDNFNLEDNFLEAEVTGPRKPEPLSKNELMHEFKNL